MSYTDPSGYFFKAIGNFFKKHWRTIVSIGVSILSTLVPGLGTAVAAGFISGWVSAGNLEGAFLSGIFSMATFGIGEAFKGAQKGMKLLKALTHAIVGGMKSVTLGGKFGHGFASAGLTAIGSDLISGIGENSVDDNGKSMSGSFKHRFARVSVICSSRWDRFAYDRR